MGRLFIAANRQLVWGVIALISMSLSACNQSATPELYAVSGRVTFQGKPVPGAKVMFFIDAKEDPKKPPPERPYGEADESGNFQLFLGDLEGAPAGKYKVTIMAFQEYGPDDDTESKPGSLIPERYNSPASSGLTAVVEEDDNTVNLELQ